MTEFSSLGLSAMMLKSLDRLNFSKATPIQAAAIPAALAGKDVLGTAQTGTGKTAAFGLPLVEHIAGDPANRTALVITPTRELAGQVQKAIESFIDRKQKIRTTLLIGGEPYFKQLRELSLNPAIIVGTPGRLNDYLMEGKLDLSQISYLVLDETDRMLDMGFSVQIDKILAAIEGPRQTMLFSATLPPKIEHLAKTYLTNPERIAVGEQSKPATDIAQETRFLSQGDKLQELISILEGQEGSAIIFVRTKYGTERMAKNLVNAGIKAEALHGDLRQRKRDNVVRAFRSKKFRVLVATDVAARGLDIPHIELVVNHDLPQVAEDYVHRIGRTARAGASGLAISFVSPAEKNLWSAITRMLNPKAKRDDHDEERRPSRSGKPRSGKPGSGKPGSGGGKRRGGSWNPVEGDKRSFDKKPHKKKQRRAAEAAEKDGEKPKPKNRERHQNKDKGKPSWAGKSAEGKREEGGSKPPRRRRFGDTPDARFDKKPGSKPKPKGKPNGKPKQKRSPGAKPRDEG